MVNNQAIQQKQIASVKEKKGILKHDWTRKGAFSDLQDKVLTVHWMQK